MLSYIIWNGSPEIFSIWIFSLRWYGLLFALGFLISQQLLYYMHRQEGKPEKDVDTLTIYMIVATIIGARLGHIIFYEPAMLWQDPLGVLLPFRFSPFHFTGFTGLASHGGAIAILFALWLYSRKKKPGQSYLQVLDRIVILIFLTAGLIRLGNYFNSEIIGKPTDSPMGVLFVNDVTARISQNEDNTNPMAGIEIKREEKKEVTENGRVPIDIYIFFKSGTTENQATSFLTWNVKSALAQSSDFIDEPNAPLNYQLSLEPSGTYAARVKTMGIVRHPAQLYESISCFLLFAFFFWYWSRYKNNLPEGRIFGWFMIILWGLRFSYEFLKENQVAFEDNLTLNMGQTLSIPLILIGIVVLIRSYKKKSESSKA